MKTTIRDIAKECNVSKTTVSRFINNSGYISKEVAERIEAKIKELNYVPSATARSLSLQKSNMIGVIIPEVSNPFFGEVFKGISQVADKNNLSVFYCDTDNNAVKEHKSLSNLRGHEIRGVILTPATGGLINGNPDDEFIKRVEDLKVPVVLLDRDVEHVHWNGVFIDNFKGAYNSTRLLIENGHTAIATIYGNQDLLIGKERLLGYKQALIDSGLDVIESNIYEGDFSTEQAYKQMMKIIEENSKVSAVFSPNNLTTMGIFKALTKKKMRVPEDIAVVGFDDVELLNMLDIHLSAIQRDPRAMGEAAMELLLKRMDNPSMKVEKIVMEPTLITRGSERKVNK